MKGGADGRNDNTGPELATRRTEAEAEAGQPSASKTANGMLW